MEKKKIPESLQYNSNNIQIQSNMLMENMTQF